MIGQYILKGRYKIRQKSMAISAVSLSPLFPNKVHKNIIFGKKFYSTDGISAVSPSNSSVIEGLINTSLYPIQYIEKYVNPQVIQHAIDTNPNIRSILAEYGLEPKISLANIDANAKNHLFSTYMYANDIASMMNIDKKQTIILEKAALLHDIGKALIPEEIIQKPGKLTPYERKIVDLHAQLGYEILKTTNVPEQVIDAVRTHHLPISSKPDDIVSQILSVADVYSALREERAYKSVLNHDEACNIMASAKELAQNIVQQIKFAKFHT